jgi:hypothetical protein
MKFFFENLEKNSAELFISDVLRIDDNVIFSINNLILEKIKKEKIEKFFKFKFDDD